MGSSICSQCTIKTEETEQNMYQIVFLNEEPPLIQQRSVLKLQEQLQLQPDTDISKQQASPQTKGILKHTAEHQMFTYHKNIETSNEKKVKFKIRD